MKSPIEWIMGENIQKFLDAVEKAADKGINDIGGNRLPKLNDKIYKYELKLISMKDDRSFYNKFLDKLEKIVKVIKE